MQIVLRLMMQVTWHSGLNAASVLLFESEYWQYWVFCFQALVFSFARCRALATAGQIFEGQGARSICRCRGVGSAVAACPSRTDIRVYLYRTVWFGQQR